MYAAQAAPTEATSAMTQPTWGFLTNYSVLLVYIVLHPESTVREIAYGIGITERATLGILRDLDDEGIVNRHREGRRNNYSVNFDRLSGVRRGGEDSALTPRPFVDGIVGMLFSIAREQGADVARLTVPKKVQEHELEARTATWGFFTNHLLVLVAIARNHEPTVRELAAAVGITERAVVGIINQLETDGVLERRRAGRRTHYDIGYEVFRRFRGWTLGDWRIPAPLIDSAIETIKALEERSVTPLSERTPQPAARLQPAGRPHRTPR